MLSGGCFPSGDYADLAPAVRRVSVVEVRIAPRTEQIELLGKTEPRREAMLYFEVAGIVNDVMIEEGQLVTLDTPLAQLVLDDFKLAVEKTSSELAAAQARLALLNAGTRKEDIEVARANHAIATAILTYWKLELSRLQELQKKSVVTDGELDLAVRERSGAGEQQRLTKALWDRAISGPRNEEIDEASATVRALDRGLALANRQLSKATLAAPFAGPNAGWSIREPISMCFLQVACQSYILSILSTLTLSFLFPNRSGSPYNKSSSWKSFLRQYRNCGKQGKSFHFHT